MDLKARMPKAGTSSAQLAIFAICSKFVPFFGSTRGKLWGETCSVDIYKEIII
jgi:hypothetical protein